MTKDVHATVEGVLDRPPTHTVESAGFCRICKVGAAQECLDHHGRPMGSAIHAYGGRHEPQLRRLADKQPTLAEAQAFVGGFVELLRLGTDRQVLCNEDGLALGLAPNLEASRVVGRVLVGNVMILAGKARWT